MHRVETDIAGEATPRCPSWSAQPCPDLVLVNDDDLTYAKIRLDERSQRDAGQRGAAGSPTTCPRALCWAAAWDMARDGELRARDFLGHGGRRDRSSSPTSRSCGPC